jgi:hypothetical protein
MEGNNMKRPEDEDNGPLPNCETCGHEELDHDGKCFVDGCKCEQYVSEGYDDDDGQELAESYQQRQVADLPHRLIQGETMSKAKAATAAALPEGTKSIFINRRTFDEYINAEFYTKPEPCRHFKAYKGLHAPICGCHPCLDKYVTVQVESGNTVRTSVHAFEPNGRAV